MTDGKCSVDDAHVLDRLTQNPGNTAQNAHNALLKMAIQRFKENGLRNFSLLIKKHGVVWLTEDNELNWIVAGQEDGISSPIKVKTIFNQLRVIACFYYYMIFLFAGLGVFALKAGRFDKRIIFLLIIVLGIVAVHMIVEASPRYHFPAIAFIALITSCGLFIPSDVSQSKKSIAEL